MNTILHVTEALGGGVTHSISQLTTLQARDGWKVVVVHSVRPETPSQEILDRLFPPPILRIMFPMVTSIAPWQDLLGVLYLMNLFRQLRPDVIHLHSSKGGAL